MMKMRRMFGAGLGVRRFAFRRNDIQTPPEGGTTSPRGVGWLRAAGAAGALLNLVGVVRGIDFAGAAG